MLCDVQSDLPCSTHSHSEAPVQTITLQPFTAIESPTAQKVDGTSLSAGTDAAAAADTPTLPTDGLNSNDAGIKSAGGSEKADRHHRHHDADKAMRRQKTTKGHGRLSDEESAAMAQMAMALAQNVAGSG